jgi:hypothetical protein
MFAEPASELAIIRNRRETGRRRGVAQQVQIGTSDHDAKLPRDHGAMLVRNSVFRMP